MISRKPTVLVVGASGVIGGNHVARLAGRDDVDVIALARRPPDSAAANVAPLPLDLLAEDHGGVGAGLTAVSHLVYAAYIDAPDWQAQRAPNLKLFQAALDLAARHCPALRHVTLLQGMKAYGSHLGPFKTPAKESDPRLSQGHFYDDQEDALRAGALRSGWTWTALRPHVVVGPARRSPQNLIAVLAVYAALEKAAGRVLSFPGPAAAFDAVYQATDADLLSRAIEWAGTSDRTHGEVFNITNGDFFRWRNVWPLLAEVFEMPDAGPEPRRLSDTIADADARWSALVTQHGLEANRLADLVSWSFADYVFNTTWDVMADTLKCRQAGFLEFVDSERMLVDRLTEMRRRALVP